jgi:hypothetical protein
MKVIIVLLFTLIGFSVFTQTRFEFGYSFGVNTTTARIVKSDNMTWGYHISPIPNLGSNHWFVGWGTKKDKLFIAYDGGEIGPTWEVRAYPNKFPLDDNVSGSTNPSVRTSFRGRVYHGLNLLKLSLLYKHTWYTANKFSHKSIAGIGYLKTRVPYGGANVGVGTYIDSLGWVEHGMIEDQYALFRLQNVYLTLGYECTFKLTNHWNINAQLMYNQGLYKMVRWHTYRTYSESATGYTEFDEQWSFSRLSYFACLIGVSYELPNKKERNAKKHLD